MVVNVLIAVIVGVIGWGDRHGNVQTLNTLVSRMWSGAALCELYRPGGAAMTSWPDADGLHPLGSPWQARVCGRRVGLKVGSKLDDGGDRGTG